MYSEQKPAALHIEQISKTDRASEAAVLRQLEAQLKGNETAFWEEVQRLFYVWDAKARGGNTVSPEKKFSIANSITFGRESVAEAALRVGYSEQLTRDARHLLYVAALIASRKFIPAAQSSFTFPLGPEPLVMYQKLEGYEAERKALEERLLSLPVKQKLATVPHLELLLCSYATYGTLEHVFRQIKIHPNGGELGDFNKEIRSFILGKRNQGVRSLAQRVLLQNWLTNSYGVGSEVNYSSLISQNIHALIETKTDSALSDYQKRMKASAVAFYELILREEHQEMMAMRSVAQQNEEPYAAGSFSQTLREEAAVPEVLREVVERFVSGETFSEITRKLMGSYGYRSSQDLFTSNGIAFLEEVLCLKRNESTARTLQRFLKRPVNIRVTSVFTALQSLNDQVE